MTTQATKPRTILFVCTGNTCRSPMAAAFAAQALRERGAAGRWRAVSAGLAASPGMPATPEAVDAAQALGASVERHSATPLTADLALAADVVYAMTMDHAMAVLRLAPEAKGRVFVLDPEGRDIPDPIGGPQRVYDHTAERMKTMVAQRLAELEANP